MPCFLLMPGCYFWRPTKWTNKIPRWIQKKNKQHWTRKPGSGCSRVDLAGNLAGERLVTPVPVSAHRRSIASTAARARRNFCQQEPVYAAQCCRPASRRRGCWSLPLAAVAVELSPASLVEVHGRLDWVYGLSVGCSAGWCFCSRASRGPWQGTSGRAPTSEWASIFSRGTGSGALGGLGLRLPRGFRPGGSWRVDEPSPRSWGSEAYCACLPAFLLGADFGSRGRPRGVEVGLRLVRGPISEGRFWILELAEFGMMWAQAHCSVVRV